MKIPVYVITAHISLVLAAIYFHTSPSIKSHKPIVVQTHVAPPNLEVQETAPNIEIQPIQEIAAAIVEQPPPAPTPKPAAAVQKKPAPKPSVKKAAPKAHGTQQEKLVALMQQSLNTLKTSSPIPSTQNNAKSVGPLASEALKFETLYEEELIAYLSNQLILPEKGEVKLKLTLKKDGSLQKLDIVNASCEKNRQYVVASLPTCSFPPFRAHFKGETAHTFSLTLTSD